MRSAQPTILFVTSHWPHAPRYGAQQRALNILRLLQRLGRVSLIVASGDEPDCETARKTFDEFDVRAVFRLAPPAMSGVDRLRCELDPTFMKTHYRVDSTDARDRMLATIAEHDVVWVFGLHQANAFEIYRWPHSILDIDDIQSRVYAARARVDGNMWRKLLDYRMSVIWRRREGRLAERFDLVAVCSEDDRHYLEARAGVPAQVIPNGFAADGVPRERKPAVPPRFGFIGLCDYEANRDGVDWFLRDVWPLVKASSRNARLRLVGRGSQELFRGAGHDVDALGYVDDPADEIATWTAMIVPIRFGGGTRVKIAEAFSRRCPIVSTSIGAFGYDAADCLLVADEPETFAAACLRLVDHPGIAERLAANGWREFITKWTWNAIEGAVEDAVRRCAERSRRLRPASLPVDPTHTRRGAKTAAPAAPQRVRITR